MCAVGLQVVLVLVVLPVVAEVGVSIYVRNEYRDVFKREFAKHVPIIAIPLRLEAASSVGGLRASPIIWVW